MHRRHFQALTALCYVTLTLLPLIWSVHGDIRRLKFKAAVYEHAVILPEEMSSSISSSQALEFMYKNLDVYEANAKLAKAQNADILVFPEHGIYGTHFSTRDSISPYLEVIPNPEDVAGWSPCSDPAPVGAAEVLGKLSCLAENNSIYIVANMAEQVVCNKTEDQNCPEDGRYQFNTDVAFDPNGTLIAKYHKRNLFYRDDLFNVDPQSRASYFDTPFGRFGMLDGFDLFSKEPALTSVKLHRVSNILLPVSWMNLPPFLSAVGFHSSFARALGVNVLAANLHLPSNGLHGSGIYTPDGVAKFYDNGTLGSPGKLLVSEINVIEEPRTLLEHTISVSFVDEEEKDKQFESNISNDVFTLRPLEGLSGELKVCQRGVCCFLEYEIEDVDNSTANQKLGELFAFGAFDGLHAHQYYLQVCTLLRCTGGLETCGNMTFPPSDTRFKSLYLMGHFQTMYTYPQVLLSHDGQLWPASGNQWNFTSKHDTYKFIESPSGFDKPLVSATLLSRDYDRDNTLTTSLVESTTKRFSQTTGTVSQSTGTVSQTTGTVNQTTGTVSQTTGTVNQTTGTVSQTTGTVSQTTGTVNQTTGTVSQTTGTVSQTTRTVNQTTGTVNQTTGTVSQTTGTVSQTTGTVSQTSIDTSTQPDTGHILSINLFHLISVFVLTLISI